MTKKKGIDWEWQALDGAMSKAPLGGEATGPNPTDRGKKGTKRSVLTDGNGIPLAITVAGANAHDCTLLIDTLRAVVVEPAPEQECLQHLCLDKGYDYGFVEEIALDFGYAPHIRARGQEKKEKQEGKKPRRWVVERTHSWINRFRRLLVRWEKKQANYLAFLQLAAFLIIYNQTPLSG
jgi:transposase